MFQCQNSKIYHFSFFRKFFLSYEFDQGRPIPMTSGPNERQMASACSVSQKIKVWVELKVTWQLVHRVCFKWYILSKKTFSLHIWAFYWLKSGYLKIVRGPQKGTWWIACGPRSGRCRGLNQIICLLQINFFEMTSFMDDSLSLTILGLIHQRHDDVIYVMIVDL